MDAPFQGVLCALSSLSYCRGLPAHRLKNLLAYPKAEIHGGRDDKRIPDFNPSGLIRRLRLDCTLELARIFLDDWNARLDEVLQEILLRFFSQPLS